MGSKKDQFAFTKLIAEHLELLIPDNGYPSIYTRVP